MRRHHFFLSAGALVVAGALTSGCSSGTPAEAAAPAASADPLALALSTVESRGLDRQLRVTGSLMAGEQADVSAEVAGRVTGTPVERGTRVAAGALLVRISEAETSAQLLEAEANAGQIEARLGLDPGQGFDPSRVPEVMNAQSALDLAQAEFSRIRTLLEDRVVSQSEYDQRRTQVEAARQGHKVALNGAEQSYRSLQAARARVALARKAVSDTAVRAPFNGLVAERAVSVGDYVTKGTRVATVVSISPIRVQLTVPEGAIAQIRAGQAVRLTVDAYPGETFHATVRFVSPSLRVDQRALTVEAVAENADGRLKPGLFATAAIQQEAPTPALTVPDTAVETIAGTSRVYVVADGRADERIVTVGEKGPGFVEITSGVSEREQVVSEPRGRVVDGMPIALQ
ncbi:efflux RND transporter periplasmic adaptor subunit [soil metagenome]